MPIEIRELHIKAEIGESGSNQGAGAGQTEDNGSESNYGKIMQELLDQLRESLKLENER